MINALRRVYLLSWLLSMVFVLPAGIASFWFKPLLAWFAPMTMIVLIPVLVAFVESISSGSTDKTIDFFVGRDKP